MSKPGNLDVVLNPPFCEPLKKFLDEFMDHSGRVFLIGAGCSKCAGLPLMEELTKKVLDETTLDPTTAEILKGIQTGFSGAKRSDIEDYLSEIIDLLTVSERREQCGAIDTQVLIEENKYSAQELREATEKIKQTIADIIINCSSKEIDISVHRKFVKAVHRPTRPGKTDNFDSVDYLCLNYDTLLEDSLALEKISFSDGLDGGVTGWWNPAVFNRSGLSSRIFKLHGSINWCEFDNDPLPRRISGNINVQPEDERRILIWPASTKYRETQRDPYAQLANLGREAIRVSQGSQKILITCGYGFGDSHINLEIDRALRESEGRLTLVIFTSEDKPKDQLEKWYKDSSITEQVLIFAKKGFFHGSNCMEAETDLPWWKFENLTRLLEGER